MQCNAGEQRRPEATTLKQNAQRNARVRSAPTEPRAPRPRPARQFRRVPVARAGSRCPLAPEAVNVRANRGAAGSGRPESESPRGTRTTRRTAPLWASSSAAQRREMSARTRPAKRAAGSGRRAQRLVGSNQPTNQPHAPGSGDLARGERLDVVCLVGFLAPPAAEATGHWTHSLTGYTPPTTAAAPRWVGLGPFSCRELVCDSVALLVAVCRLLSLLPTHWSPIDGDFRHSVR